jgi:hypothetical protein
LLAQKLRHFLRRLSWALCNQGEFMIKLILVSLIVLFSASVTAEKNYFCTINAVSEVNENGGITEVYITPYKGESFSVSEETGVMKGFLQNTLGGTPEIIQPVSNDYEFKVFTKSVTNHTDGYYFQVKDFKWAKTKPFMFIQSGFIYHGLCQ